MSGKDNQEDSGDSGFTHPMEAPLDAGAELAGSVMGAMLDPFDTDDNDKSGNDSSDGDDD